MGRAVSRAVIGHSRVHQVPASEPWRALPVTLAQGMFDLLKG
jgi:hypothetical protein